MPQPRRSLRLLTPKCFISPARPPGRPGHPSVGLLCCVCGTHREEEEAQSCLGGPEGVSGTGSKSGFWCPFTCPPPPPTPPKSDLLWPLRHVLFLTPSWNWLSSSKNQALFLVVPTRPQLPVKRELIYIFIYLLFVLGWVCVQSQGVRCSHCRLGECLADLDLGATILPLPLWLPSVFDSRCSFESPSSRSMCPRLDTDPLLKQVARAKAPGGKDVPAPHLEGWPFCHGFSPALCPLPPAIPVKG